MVGFAYQKGAYLNICHIIPLHGCHTASLVKLDLPNPGQVRQEIPNKLASLDIPHLESPIGPRDHLDFIVLETCYGPGVCRERVLALSRLRIPNAKCRISSRGDEFVVAQIQKPNQLAMSLECIDY